MDRQGTLTSRGVDKRGNQALNSFTALNRKGRVTKTALPSRGSRFRLGPARLGVGCRRCLCFCWSWYCRCSSRSRRQAIPTCTSAGSR